jgi:hypothetical protein
LFLKRPQSLVRCVSVVFFLRNLLTSVPNLWRNLTGWFLTVRFWNKNFNAFNYLIPYNKTVLENNVLIGHCELKVRLSF